VLYSYILNIFLKFLAGNILLNKERIFEMEETYKYFPSLFNIGYVQTVQTQYLKTNVLPVSMSIKHSFD